MNTLKTEEFAIQPEESEDLLDLIAKSITAPEDKKAKFDNLLCEFTRLDARAKYEEFNFWLDQMRESLD
jgi:hypothetical protein